MNTTNAYLIALESRFNALWTDTPVCYDNTPFSVPDPAAPWVRFEVYDGEVVRTSLGPTYNQRAVGTVFVSVYTPKDIGSATARGLVDKVLDIYRKYQVTTPNGVLTMFDAQVKRIGEAYSSASGSSISGTTASINGI